MFIFFGFTSFYIFFLNFEVSILTYSDILWNESNGISLKDWTKPSSKMVNMINSQICNHYLFGTAVEYDGEKQCFWGEKIVHCWTYKPKEDDLSWHNS